MSVKATSFIAELMSIMYREVPSVANKASWSMQHTGAIADPNFTTGTLEQDQE